MLITMFVVCISLSQTDTVYVESHNYNYINTYSHPKVIIYQYDAHKGIAEAQFKLSRAYYKGDGIKQNKQLAAFWLLKAIANGNYKARKVWERLKYTNY